MKKRIAVLGSTGSVGTQCLTVCRQRGFQIAALTAHQNTTLLAKQAREFLPDVVVIGKESEYATLKTLLADTPVVVKAGAEAIASVAAREGVDIVFNSLLGIAGLRPTLAALEAGNTLALSNKEALIAGGELVMNTAKKNNVKILPVDSEHSAIWQALAGSRREDLRSIILTASGGPFFGKTRDELAQVTVRDTLKHPNWSMGAKITVDSATLMNKGLEFIEAMWFFDVTPEEIEVVVHRQSVLHSAVDYYDGTVMGQMSVPDMAGAIQYALVYPARPKLEVKRLSLTEYGALTFEKPDLDTFTCLATSIAAAKKGGLYPCLANSANEQAVELFLQEKIKFLDIGDLVAKAVNSITPPAQVTLDTIEETDRLAREFILEHTVRK